MTSEETDGSSGGFEQPRDSITQVKLVGENAQALSVFIKLITGVVSPVLLLYQISFFIIIILATFAYVFRYSSL